MLLARERERVEEAAVGLVVILHCIFWHLSVCQSVGLGVVCVF